MASLRALIVIAGTLATTAAPAATITQSLDFFLVGDDPHTAFTLPLGSFLPQFPLEMSFQGTATNLLPLFEDARLGVTTHAGQNPQVTVTDSFTLPDSDPPIDVPIAVSRTFATVPSQLILNFATFGPADNSHVVGTVILTGTVPEPSTLAMLLAALPLAFLAYGRRRS
jgi:hypothetical protein